MVSGIITPVGRILVKEIEVENKTAGGIILSGESDPENKARYGEIVCNGIMKEGSLNTTYKEGRKVFFGKFAGANLHYEGVKYISIQETEILAITN